MSSYVNPLAWELAGQLINSPQFPKEDIALRTFQSVRGVSSETIVQLILTDARVSGHIDLIRSAVDGMDTSGIALVVATVLDKHFPSIIDAINASDSDLALYKEVIIGLSNNLFNVEKTEEVVHDE